MRARIFAIFFHKNEPVGRITRKLADKSFAKLFRVQQKDSSEQCEIRPIKKVGFFFRPFAQFSLLTKLFLKKRAEKQETGPPMLTFLGSGGGRGEASPLFLPIICR